MKSLKNCFALCGQKSELLAQLHEIPTNWCHDRMGLCSFFSRLGRGLRGGAIAYKVPMRGAAEGPGDAGDQSPTVCLLSHVDAF